MHKITTVLPLNISEKSKSCVKLWNLKAYISKNNEDMYTLITMLHKFVKKNNSAYKSSFITDISVIRKKKRKNNKMIKNSALHNLTKVSTC